MSTYKEQMKRDVEQRALTTRRQVVYQTTNTLIDKATGEIIQEQEEKKVRTSSEPEFIKIYYKAMLAVNGIEGLPLDFVLALSSVIAYCNDPDKPIYFYNNKANRRIIADCCLKKNGEPISDNMVARYIKCAKDLSLLFETDDRGIYEVNPCMIARGQWKHISKLQASFDFTGKKWERTMKINVNENSKPFSEDDELDIQDIPEQQKEVS